MCIRDRYATITEVWIKGFASPEGSYANNTYLAENRAKALRDYVKSLYRFEHATDVYKRQNVDGFDYSEPDVPLNERPEIDRWILSLLNTLVKDVDGFYDTYEPTRAGRAISEFVNDNLSNWYVRLNRRCV